MELKRAVLAGFGLALWTTVGLCSAGLVVSPSSVSVSSGSVGEVSVRVSGNQAYYLEQFLSAPLRDSDGHILQSGILQCVVSLSSPAVGDVIWPAGDAVTTMPKRLYISDNNGHSISLKLIYSLSLGSNITPGHYRGELIYRIKDEQGRVLSVYRLALRIVVEGIGSSNRSLRLLEGRVSGVELVIDSPVRLLGEGELPAIEVRFLKNGAVFLPWTPLKNGIVLKEAGNYIMEVRLASDVMAGSYSGRLVAYDMHGKESFSVNVSADIEERFSLDVNDVVFVMRPSEDGGLVSSPVEISISNNLGRDFMIYGKLNVISPESARRKSSADIRLEAKVMVFCNGKWRQYRSWSPVYMMRQVVYVSDVRHCNANKLKVIYRISPKNKKKMLAGEYEFNVSFYLMPK